MKLWKRTIAVYAVASMTVLGIPAPAAAAMIATDQAAAPARSVQQERARIDALLAREDVRQGLVQHGVTPEQAKARIAALSDGEVLQVAGRLDALPAGGDGGSVLGAILIIFFVLLITDILGWTKVYPFTRSIK